MRLVAEEPAPVFGTPTVVVGVVVPVVVLVVEVCAPAAPVVSKNASTAPPNIFFADIGVLC